MEGIETGHQWNGQTRKEVKKKVRVDRKDSKSTFIQEFTSQVNDLAQHLHNLLPGEVLLGMDFSENFRTQYQREVSSAHWSYQQVTVFPIVAHYLYPEDGCEIVVKKAIGLVSDHLKHDARAVDVIVEAPRKHLTEKRKLNIQKQIHCSDQCGIQFKCQKAIYSCATNTKPIHHMYFGVGHGKSLMDGEGAVVKSHVTRAVQAQDITVDNAADFVTACKSFSSDTSVHEQHLGGKSTRRVLQVHIGDNGPCERTRRLNGTGLVHSITNIPGKPRFICHRKQTCFSDHCEGLTEDAC